MSYNHDFKNQISWSDRFNWEPAFDPVHLKAKTRNSLKTGKIWKSASSTEEPGTGMVELVIDWLGFFVLFLA